MVGSKFAVTCLLLFTAVPAGCLPLMTAGAIGGEMRDGGTVQRGQQGLSAGSLIFIAVAGVLALAANWVFWRMVRRVRRQGEETWLGLSAGPWMVLLFTAFGFGLVCGGYFLVVTSTI